MSKIVDDNFIPLDAEEAEIIRSLERNEWTVMPEKKQEKFLSDMKESIEFYSKKTKPISLRFHYPVLAGLKAKAKETGLPYQNILSLLAKQYIEGKISLQI